MERGRFTVLAGFIRNKLQANQSAAFKLGKSRVFVVPSSAWGDTIPALLVANERGGSLLVTPATVMYPGSFVAGGFSLHQATELANVFRVIRDNHAETLSVRKHNGSSPDDPSA